MAPLILPIYLVGPGGAGKSTIGAALAERLGCPFHDLDREFERRQGDIDAFIESHGYPGYAGTNVVTFLELAPERLVSVWALSSGFMVYPESIHPAYRAATAAIATSPTTVVLLPSLVVDVCVSETVRRQLLSPFGCRSPDREAAVIKRRFAQYVALPAPKLETMRPLEETLVAIEQLLSTGRSRHRAQSSQ